LSDSAEKIVRISNLANILHGFADLINTADCGLSNILARIVDFACNLVRILDCDFIVELLADPNLDKTIVARADSVSNLGGSADLYTPIPPPPPILETPFLAIFQRRILDW
jgi:hypothetical protein